MASLEAATNVRTALLAAVGHDLRTPLAAAKASVTGLLSQDIELSLPDQRELLSSADASLDKLTALVANLLDMSRLQLGAMPVVRRGVALEEVVARALDDLGGPSVEVDVPADLPEALADAGLLERVVVNLVQNSLRYSSEIALRARQVESTLELHVIDHGPGVPPDEREEMFTPFQRMGDTTTVDGLGLGLAVARGLVEAMGGTLVPRQTDRGGLTLVVAVETAP